MEWIILITVFGLFFYAMYKVLTNDLTNEDGVLQEPEVTLIRPAKQEESVSISHGMGKEPVVVKSEIVKKPRYSHRPKKLDGYERELIQWTKAGYSQTKIGDLLGVSQSTVSDALKRIKEKKVDHSEYQKVARERGIM